MMWGLSDKVMGLDLPARLMISRAFLVAVFGLLALLAVVRWRTLRHVLLQFFTASGSPLNLAIYRIVLFATILVDPDVDYELDRMIFFARLPRQLQMPNPGLEWLLPHVPITPGLALTSFILLRTFSVAAIIGLFSRTSALLVVIVALYALGLPQFYGQVNHYHHLVWFAALLAASPCGDALSVDALVRAWRRGGAGSTAPAPPAGA